MKLNFIFLLTVALTFWTSVLQAGAGDGLGLFLDFGQLKALNNDTETEYQTSKKAVSSMTISSLWVILFLSHFSAQNSVEKGNCRTTQNMNITKRAS